MSSIHLEQIEQLKNAITALETQREVLGEAVVAATIDALRQQLHRLQPETVEPERRLVTVLSTDVVDSTRLGQELAAEDFLEIMDRALQRLAARVEARGGKILRFMGDGLLALFGARASRENDAEQAVRAGLEILEEARSISAEISRRSKAQAFQVRVGVNTGIVAMGGISEAENMVMGLPVNLGVRLESAAPPGGMLISHTTYHQVRGMFDLQPLEPITAKGFPEPVPVFLVKASLPGTFATVNRGLEGIETPMIGREVDFERLKETFSAVLQENQPRILTIIGDPGLGKSRLLAEFERWVLESGKPALIFRARGRPEMANSPYALLRELFADQFSIQENDPATMVAPKLERGIEQGYSSGQLTGETLSPETILTRAHFIGQLLGYDFSHSPYLQGVAADARQLHDRARMYLADYFRSVCSLQPVFIFLDDIHWADDGSLDFILAAQQSWRNRPVLVVCLARPVLLDRRPEWGIEQAGQARLDLRPLDVNQGKLLVKQLLRHMIEVPPVLLDLVISRAEGNPFFIEELIQMLIDQGVILTGEEPWKIAPQDLSEALSSNTVPTSLVGVLQARLDSLLPAEKTVLQQASVVGRVFWDESLSYIAEKSGNAGEVSIALAALADKGMIFLRRTSSLSGTREFIFKHSLMRDVVYDSVVRRVRQAYHSLAAEWLVAQGDASAVELDATIAEHLELSGETERAAIYLRKAGEQAARRYANDQALHYLGRALQLAPETDLLERFCSLVARTQVFSLLGARQKQEGDLEELVRLAEQMKDKNRRAEATLLQAAYASEKSDYPKVIAQSRKAIRLARASAQPNIEAQAHLLWGRALLSQGDYPAARASFDQALGMARAADLKPEEADSLRKLGTTALRLGETALARQHYESALEIYRQIGDRRGEGRALNGLGNALLVEGDLERGQRCFAEFLEISREIGDRLGEGKVVQEIGDAHLEQADYQGAVEYFEQALKIGREIGNRTIESSALVGMGNVLLQRSEFTRAKGNFDESLKIARQIGNRPWEAKTLMELGRLIMRQGDYSQARDHLNQALELYRQIGESLGESRALIDQGALFELLGDATSARQSAESALALARDLKHPRYTGLALTLLGFALAMLGDREQAIQAFREAVTLFEENGFPNQAVESHAGLAELYLAQGELSLANEQVQEVLRWLEPAGSASADASPSLAPSLENAADPLRVYLIAYRVLKTLGDPHAVDLLRLARQLLSRKAAGLSDKYSTDALLYNIPTHRDILREYRKVGAVDRVAARLKEET